MFLVSKLNINFNLFLIVILYLSPFVIGSFLNIQKISDVTKDYFVILDSGLYIYNFENHKCRTIKNFENLEFDINYNIITKYENSDTRQIKIASLINLNLYVYTYDDSNEKIEFQFLKCLEDNDHNTYPFYVQIKNSKLVIYFLKYEIDVALMKYFLRSYNFESYSDINGEPQTKKYDDKFMNEPECLTDVYNLLIKCIYVSFVNSNLQFLTMKESGNKYTKVEDIKIDGGGILSN